MEYLVEPETAIKQYFSNRKVLYLLILLNLLFETLMTIYIIKNEEFIIKELNQIYRFWHLNDFRRFFETVTAASSGINVILYFYGFYTVYSHKVTNYQLFTVLLMVSVFFGILLTYLNVLNLLMFLMKCFTYVYARYVLS